MVGLRDSLRPQVRSRTVKADTASASGQGDRGGTDERFEPQRQARVEAGRRPSRTTRRPRRHRPFVAYRQPDSGSQTQPKIDADGMKTFRSRSGLPVRVQGVDRAPGVRAHGPSVSARCHQDASSASSTSSIRPAGPVQHHDARAAGSPGARATTFVPVDEPRPGTAPRSDLVRWTCPCADFPVLRRRQDLVGDVEYRLVAFRYFAAAACTHCSANGVGG